MKNPHHTLEYLNSLRVAVGKKPLKAWKESKAKLDEAVNKLLPRNSDGEVIGEGVIASGAPKRVKKSIDEEANTNPHDFSTVTLVAIAKELGINPRVARAKMRRVSVPADFLAGKHTYHEQHKAWVVDALKRDFRKK